MTIAQANTIFKTKYPEGSIFPRSFGSNYSEATMKNKVAVMFSENGKVYIYFGSYEKSFEKHGFCNS